MSDDEYFEMLEKSVDKYEYWNGVAVAMTGFTPEHVHVESNIVGELFQQLRGRECRPIGSSQAVKLAGSKGYVFPDLTVVCGKPEHIVRGNVGCLLNPVLVVEVSSPRTIFLDEFDKLLAYTGIRTVREYLVVYSDRYGVKLYSRHTADEVWSVRGYAELADTVELESCGCRLTLAEIYASVVPTVPALYPAE